MKSYQSKILEVDYHYFVLVTVKIFYLFTSLWGVCNSFNLEHFGEFSFSTPHVCLQQKSANFDCTSAVLFRQCVGCELTLEFLIKDSSRFSSVGKRLAMYKY